MKKFIGHLDGVITMSMNVKEQIMHLAKKEINCKNIFLPIDRINDKVQWLLDY